VLDRYRGDRVVDLGGRFTMPGFIDTHIHIA
jgi:predicted amidohydrolase YtcJ